MGFFESIVLRFSTLSCQPWPLTAAPDTWIRRVFVSHPRWATKPLFSFLLYHWWYLCLPWRCWRALRVTDWFRTTWIKMQRAYYPWCMNVKLRCLVFQYHTLRISVCGSESITFTQSGTYRLRLLSLLVKGVREQSLFFNAFMLISAESSVVRVVMNYDSDKIQCEAWRSNARGSLISYGHTSFAFPMYFNSRRHTIQQC
jgi:hypothetical protein